MFEANQRVRIVLLRHPKEDIPTILRGSVVECEDGILKLQGRRFAKILEPTTNRAEEKPLDAVEKCYMIPLHSVRFAELIQPNSAEAELDERIRQEPLLRRKGSLALLD